MNLYKPTEVLSTMLTPHDILIIVEIAIAGIVVGITAFIFLNRR